MRQFFRKLVIGLLRFQINTIALFSMSAAGHKALDLFRTPRKGRLREQDHTFLAGAKWETVHAVGLDIQTYLWEGDGPTILLAHGWESNSGRWRTFINLLRKKGYRIVALDAPGHGATSSKRFDAVWYAQALEAVAAQYRPSFIAGHSAGGMALLYYLSAVHPDFVKGAVVIAAPCSLRQVLNNFNGVMHLSERAMLGMEMAINDQFGLPADSFNLFDFAEKAKVPGLVMYDACDEIASFAEGQKLGVIWKKSHFEGYSGLGHSMNNKAVAEEMVEFMEETLNPSAH